MQKEGHLKVTSNMNHFYPKYHFWIAVGSITPDLLYHTYFRGHTYDAAKELTYKRIRRLEKKGRLNIHSSFMLGYILHYIEDFFTYPHNSHFGGSMKEHISYEMDQVAYLKRNREFFGPYRTVSFETAEEVINWLEEIHQEYLESEASIQTDLKYIFMTTECVMKHFGRRFEQKEPDYGNDGETEDVAVVNL